MPGEYRYIPTSLEARASAYEAILATLPQEPASRPTCTPVHRTVSAGQLKSKVNMADMA